MIKICEKYIPASVEEVQTRMRALRKRGYLPKNRAPNLDEVEACSQFLNTQIQIISPKIIVTLGRHSTAHILSKAGFNITSISSVHGKVFNVQLFGRSFTVIPMYHPAASLYNPKYKDAIQKDFQTLKNEVDKTK